MDFQHHNIRTVINDDRLSSLPDELIHKILSYLDTKFAVQTSSLSSRWKLLWTSMPYLNFFSRSFSSLPKFSKFVTHVLSRRNHQTEVSSVKLDFAGAASQVFVTKIANYAFTHGVQELAICIFPKKHRELPLCLFNSQSLEHLTLRTYYTAACITPKTPWDFPALTTLHLSEITLCDETTSKSIDIFSKCVNLKDLTLNHFIVNGVEVFDIVTPKLANLKLIHGSTLLKVVNLVAPQLKNLTIDNCLIENINAPPGLSSFFYRGLYPLQFYKNGFHSLDNATLDVRAVKLDARYARMTINMLRELHSVKFLTLNVEAVEGISSFPDLLSHHPSPFDNLKCLNINSGETMNAYKITMSTQLRNFFLENSPTATFIMDLPEPPPTKSTKQKEARARKKAMQKAEVERVLAESQVLLERVKMRAETEMANEMARIKTDFESLIPELEELVMKMHCENEQVDRQKELVGLLVERFTGRVLRMWFLFKDEATEIRGIHSKMALFAVLVKKLPKRQRTEMGARCFEQLEALGTLIGQLESEMAPLEGYKIIMSNYIPTASQPSSSGSVPTSSSATPDPMP